MSLDISTVNNLNNYIYIPEVIIEHVPIHVDVDRRYILDTHPNIHINNTMDSSNYIVDVVV